MAGPPPIAPAGEAAIDTLPQTLICLGAATQSHSMSILAVYAPCVAYRPLVHSNCFSVAGPPADPGVAAIALLPLALIGLGAAT